jgi:hypothetical protein
MPSTITIVSGLPRSGTSLMMQMLDGGGIPVVTDNVRARDEDNPRGYYEFEPVKKIKSDASWLPATRGKAFKMVSQLLYDLPAGETYRVIFLERDLDEVLVSQEKMLARLGRPAAPRADMKRAYALHLEQLHKWLARRPDVAVLLVAFGELVETPRGPAQRVSEFLGGRGEVAGMLKAVDPSLYRNRKGNGPLAARLSD